MVKLTESPELCSVSGYLLCNTPIARCHSSRSTTCSICPSPSTCIVRLANCSVFLIAEQRSITLWRSVSYGLGINVGFDVLSLISQLLLFNIVPTFFDIIIALVLFAVRFEWTLTVVIFCVMAAYGMLASGLYYTSLAKYPLVFSNCKCRHD